MMLASLGVLGIAYTPQTEHKSKPSREFIKSTYIRPTRVEKWRASEARKEQILADIRMIRNNIRQQAEIYCPDKDTKIVARTSIQKTGIHCTKLITQIVQKVYEDDIQPKRKIDIDNYTGIGNRKNVAHRAL